MRGVVATLSVLGLILCSGCITAAKRGLAEAEGASATMHPLNPISAGALNASGYKIGTIGADGAGAPEFSGDLQKELNLELAKAKQEGKIKTGTGEPLTINATVRFYTSKGMGKLIGGMSFAIARVDVMNSAGQLVGKGDVMAKTKALRTDTADLAKAMAKKIIEWATTGKT
jgi:hypothetical protein